MATLNVLCGICSEFYKENDIVFATYACGHSFHSQCLSAWLRRNQSCPQCRKTCTRQMVIRLYLNFRERQPEDDEGEEASSTALLNTPHWMPIFEGLPDDESHGVPNFDVEGAIKAGTDTEGNDTYVARVYYGNDLLPAAYVPAKKGAYTPWGCHGHFVTEDIEVLVDTKYQWVKAENGCVPEGALIVGYSEIGENLYAALGQYEGFTLIGKVHPSHRVMYMPFNGQEVNVKQYEVLVHVK